MMYTQNLGFFSEKILLHLILHPMESAPKISVCYTVTDIVL